jgi:hypothetical protein
MSVPMWEDNWETDEDGRSVRAPYLVSGPIVPGYPGPERYGHWPGVFENGKQVEPIPGIGGMPGHRPPPEEQ